MHDEWRNEQVALYSSITDRNWQQIIEPHPTDRSSLLCSLRLHSSQHNKKNPPQDMHLCEAMIILHELLAGCAWCRRTPRCPRKMNVYMRNVVGCVSAGHVNCIVLAQLSSTWIAIHIYIFQVWAWVLNGNDDNSQDSICLHNFKSPWQRMGKAVRQWLP